MNFILVSSKIELNLNISSRVDKIRYSIWESWPRAIIKQLEQTYISLSMKV